ncbi:hypothetical protein AB4305_13520 [Nocardia sp. 2YAB30]|uniref:hypothetical protein n=1 Tax=unclassified Nocardia TaxID=2637762 RepID=UPI003F9B2381
MSSNMRDLWEAQHRDCHLQPAIMDRERASFVLSLHAGHGGGYAQYLAALQAVSTVVG